MVVERAYYLLTFLTIFFITLVSSMAKLNERYENSKSLGAEDKELSLRLQVNGIRQERMIVKKVQLVDSNPYYCEIKDHEFCRMMGFLVIATVYALIAAVLLIYVCIPVDTHFLGESTLLEISGVLLAFSFISFVCYQLDSANISKCLNKYHEWSGTGKKEGDGGPSTGALNGLQWIFVCLFIVLLLFPWMFIALFIKSVWIKMAIAAIIIILMLFLAPKGWFNYILYITQNVDSGSGSEEEKVKRKEQEQEQVKEEHENNTGKVKETEIEDI